MTPIHFMQHAVRLGLRQLGNTGPNPAVGCVLVKEGRIIARAATATGGRPHAEMQVLEQAGSLAAGADVYVTLEPCAHHGNTPPCAEALIQAGVRQVTYAVQDPDPRVNGKGVARMQQAGITVHHLPCAEADALHAGFVKRMTQQLPYITLKLATSLDGRIALADGQSKWITNATSRAYAHHLRASHDAILAGSNTIRRDNPLLTCRLPGLEERSPIRVVLDAKGSLPQDAAVFSAPGRVYLFTAPSQKKYQPTENKQIFYTYPQEDGTLPLRDVCRTLADQGINRLLVEGGSKLAASFLSAQFVDAIIWLQSPKLIGGSGLPAIGSQYLSTLEETYGFRVRSAADFEGDRLLELVASG